MKQYPSIGKSFPEGKFAYAFNKEDGSNLRFEWSKKRDWFKFGTRKRMFDESDPVFGNAINLFINKYGNSLVKIINDNYKVESFIAYAEFLGPNSFAGHHDPNDVKDVILFDVNLHKKGFISPKEFVKLFSEIHIPRLIFSGFLTKEFYQDVKNNKFNTPEGVICKGSEGKESWMCKIKTNEYLDKLKTKFSSDWEKYC